MNWTAKDIPAQAGRLTVITGASGGLGLEMATVLASKGASIVVAARDSQKGAAAVAKIGDLARFEQLDLADLSNVRAFAQRLIAADQPIALLINNAGLAAPPKRRETRDGFEMQFGTNFLGHFVLTALLLPLLRHADKARVVTVSSLVEKSVTIDFDNLMWTRNYSPTKSYGTSKLANLLFARELQRRSDANGWGILSVAAHPGIAMTDLTKSRPDQPVLRFNRFFDLVSPLIGQTVDKGALPILYAATSPDAAPGGYYGPQGCNDMRGPPGPARSSKISQDPAVAARLWHVAEQLTHVTF